MNESAENSEQLSVEKIRGFFNDPRTVEYYMRAAVNLGLWESEKGIFRKWLPNRTNAILDLGCGAGRIAFGLAELAYENVIGADLAEEMVERARGLDKALGKGIEFQCEDATNLRFKDGRFDAVVFGFNGLMQIPDWDKRLLALREVRRCLSPGGIFIFTTLDRGDRLYSKVFAREDLFEHDVGENPSLIDFGDRLFETEHGTTFMHVPSAKEIRTALEEVGFMVLESSMRSEIAVESKAVLEFSEDCRFWVVGKR